jgi:hypothetical protein
MQRLAKHAALALAALSTTALAGCGIEDNLLEPQQPGIITPESVANAGATGAVALYTGALGALQAWECGGGTLAGATNNSQNMCMYSDLLTDVWKTSDTFTQRIDMDRRVVQPNDAEITGRYATMQQTRGFLRDAINSLRANAPTQTDKIAEMYWGIGLTETALAEYFCNGIPLGETVGGVPTYTKGYTNVEVYNFAVAHFDSASTILGAGTADSTARVRRAIAVVKARALVDLGKFTEAAAAVASVPTDYQYVITYSQPTVSNAIWQNNYASSSSARYAVGDSAAIVQGVEAVVRNAIPFGSAKDPRVPVTGSYKTTSTTGFDGTTPYVRADVYSARETPIVVASGIDARLIEAEAKLQASDIAGMMTILNTLRTNAQKLGSLAVPAMAALATPATKDAATDLFFREKAFWQFARGLRLGDLRRLIRQYGRTEDKVFPEGGFHKSPFTFGDDVNFSVPDSEKQNPNFTGCLDRKA